MEYSINLQKLLDGKVDAKSIPNTDQNTEYIYLNVTHKSLPAVIGAFFTNLFVNISDEQAEKLVNVIDQNNTDNKKNDKHKFAPIIIKDKTHQYDLGNRGTKDLVKYLKKMFDTFNEVVNFGRIEGDILFKNLPDERNEELKKYIFDKEEKQVNIGLEIKSNKQIVFTGAPGTGKTWSVRNYVEKVTKEREAYKFVQFHSSYDYTDFVEGLRPVPDGNGGNMFVRMDGTFKAFCRKIVKENLDRLKDSKFNITDIDSYFQFMKESKNKDKIYEFLDEKLYYFIIDEINRADLSRVFGELMFGLEDSYREIHNRFDTQYKNLPTYEMKDGKAEPLHDDCFKDGFFVPANLHIIGTMNDIDRSVESFDFALRRRFVWVDIKANSIMFDSLKSMRDNNNNESLTDEKLKLVVENIKNMNNRMTETGYGLSEAYHIGPAYFKELVIVSDDEVENKLEEIFTNRIDSILREYTRGRRSNVDVELIEPCKIALLGRENE